MIEYIYIYFLFVLYLSSYVWFEIRRLVFRGNSWAGWCKSQLYSGSEKAMCLQADEGGELCGNSYSGIGWKGHLKEWYCEFGAFLRSQDDQNNQFTDFSVHSMPFQEVGGIRDFSALKIGFSANIWHGIWKSNLHCRWFECLQPNTCTIASARLYCSWCKVMLRSETKRKHCIEALLESKSSTMCLEWPFTGLKAQLWMSFVCKSFKDALTHNHQSNRWNTQNKSGRQEMHQNDESKQFHQVFKQVHYFVLFDNDSSEFSVNPFALLATHLLCGGGWT